MCQPQPAGGRTDRVIAGMSGVEARTCPTPPDVWVWDRGRGVPALRTVARNHDDSRGKPRAAAAPSLVLSRLTPARRADSLNATCRGAPAPALSKAREA